MSDSLRPRWLQQAGVLCPPLVPRVCLHSCPRSWWGYLIISPLSPPSPPALNPSQHQGLFQWVSSLHQLAKYWSFSFSTGPSNEHSGLISFRMDWFDLHAVQETLKNLFQHHNLKTSILSCLAFLMVQPSHPYMMTGKNSFDYIDCCQPSDVSAF